MLHRLCGPPSIPLSFNLAAVLPRRRTYRVCFGTEQLPTQHQVLIVYSVDYQGINPVRSPRFRTSASVLTQVAAFATGVPPDIYAFHRYTRNSATLCQTLVKQYQMPFPG